MNAELERRWRQGLRPFDGPVLVVEGDGLSEDALLATVRLALGLLEEVHGSTGLHVNQDWHDHDGFINAARSVAWTDVWSWAQDSARLRASCSDDWRVCNLLFPDDFAFCLRYWVGDETDAFDAHACDLCAEQGLLQRLAAALRGIGVAVTIEPSAKAHFDRRSAG